MPKQREYILIFKDPQMLVNVVLIYFEGDFATSLFCRRTFPTRPRQVQTQIQSNFDGSPRCHLLHRSTDFSRCRYNSWHSGSKMVRVLYS
jgi:hypothetical protein